MKNKITGWLLFAQLSYVCLFVLLAVLDGITHGLVVSSIAQVRNAVGLPNTYIRLSSYVSSTLAFTIPLNAMLCLAFIWGMLRKAFTLDLSKDLFNLVNVFYIAASGWLAFGLMFSAMR